jgi:hypothetical protein
VAAELLESLEHSGRRDFLADLVAGIIAEHGLSGLTSL